MRPVAAISAICSEVPCSLDHRRQHIARLRVRGADRERAGAVVLEVRGDAADVLHLAQHAHGAFDHALAGRSHLRQRAAMPHEDLETQLILELPQLFADGRLRGVELGGGGGDVQVALRDGGEESQLLQLHANQAHTRRHC
jgi:hypothetical protein